MKKIISIICLLLVITCTTFAQGNKDKKEIREKVKAQRVAYITTKLKLSEKEAQDFWPIYNSYEKKKKTIHKANKKSLKSMNDLSESEAEQIIDADLQLATDLLMVKKEFILSLKTVLPMQKVAKFSRVDNNFKRWMLQQTRKIN